MCSPTRPSGLRDSGPSPPARFSGRSWPQAPGVGNGHHADAVRPPLHRQAFRHGEHTRLGNGRGHREGPPGDGGGGQDAEHHALVLLGDPVASGSHRAVDGPVQRGAENGVDRARRQLVGACDEGGRRVVDQNVQRRSARCTWAPSAAKRRDIAAPRPLPPPVTRICLPANRSLLNMTRVLRWVRRPTASA